MRLVVGNTTLSYTVRESARAKHKRIVVTPAGVEVVAPPGTPLDGPHGVVPYVEGKRRWVFDAVREVEARRCAVLEQRYGSGAKLQFRGRSLMLDVQPGEVDRVRINCRSKLLVVHPRELEGADRFEAVRAGFDAWLRMRALDDVERAGAHHEAQLGVKAVAYRLSEASGRWGSCGKDGVIHVHWQLVQAPAAALDYVVAHEVAHLLHRNHSPAFWATLAKTSPDWKERKAMLETWEVERRGV